MPSFPALFHKLSQARFKFIVRWANFVLFKIMKLTDTLITQNHKESSLAVSVNKIEKCSPGYLSPMILVLKVFTNTDHGQKSGHMNVGRRLEQQLCASEPVRSLKSWSSTWPDPHPLPLTPQACTQRTSSLGLSWSATLGTPVSLGFSFLAQVQDSSLPWASVSPSGK